KIIEIENLKASTKYKLDDIIKTHSNNYNFLSRLKNVSQDGSNPIIAEIKRKSPSKGNLDSELDVKALSKIYEDNGAACISVLTDEKFFGGNIRDLQLVKESVSIPVLRKDFIIDEYQLLESKYNGADCVLLIVACLEEKKLQLLLQMCEKLNLQALVEVHTLDEMHIALRNEAYLIGINNRNLKTFEVDINTTTQLSKLKNGNTILVSESGLKDRETLDKLKKCGVDAFLIGESLVTSQNPSKNLRELVGNVK
ncbi:MAG: indole-3-glycerol phosphate synthase TrpC, partial [Pseudomonadota bacterium]|nr:indole-3-glycerol phosphate synthase TrpC [Pseudomonadota bacterium]